MKHYLVIFMIIFVCLSCGDILVGDISNKHVNIVCPISNSTLKAEKVTFVWDILEHSDDYHVVIVSPSFDDIQTYVCDSIVKSYKLTLPLSPGYYEWSVQARNYGYISPKTIMSFKVEQP